MNWVLLYLLVGFVLDWFGSSVMRLTRNTPPLIELAAIIFWPLAIIFSLVTKTRKI